MTPQQYRQFSPSTQIFDPMEPPLLPEDPEWPTPTTDVEVKKLLQRLPHKSQVLCVIVAVEMALARWSGLPENNLQRRTLQLLQAIHVWLRDEESWVRDEEGSMEVVRQLNRQLQRAIYEAGEDIVGDDLTSDEEWAAYQAEVGPASAAQQAGFVVYTAAGGVGRRDWAFLASIGVQYAAAALGQYSPSHYTFAPYFLRRWWSRCRQLLAFRDVETAEVSGRRFW